MLNRLHIELFVRVCWHSHTHRGLRWMKQNHRPKESRLTDDRSTTGGEKRKVAEKAMKTSFHLWKAIQSHQWSLEIQRTRSGTWPHIPFCNPRSLFWSRFWLRREAETPSMLKVKYQSVPVINHQINISSADECSLYWTTSILVTASFIFLRIRPGLEVDWREFSSCSGQIRRHLPSLH